MTAGYRQTNSITFLWRQKSVEYSHTKSLCIRRKSIKTASFIKCCAETILNLIVQSYLECAYVRFIEWTYEQKTCVRVSFRCEIYESQMILSLHATEWFQLSACKRLLINIININITNHHNLEQRATRTAYIFKKPAILSDNIKCVRLLRPWPDAKHFPRQRPFL